MVTSPEKTSVSNKTIEAFHMMWDSFPHPVLLLKKNRDIVAVNKRAQEKGVNPCLKCFQLGGQIKVHEGCQANEALKEGVAQRKVVYNNDTSRVTDAYWLPVLAEEELYLHFAIYINLSTKN